MKTERKETSKTTHPKRVRLAFLLQCVLFALAATGSAYAQETESNEAKSEITTLPAVRVEAEIPEETAHGPVHGYVAKRSATASKTDTPLIEMPQSISVVTRDELDARGVQTISDAIRYSAGVGLSGLDGVTDPRRDRFRIRGFDQESSLYIDGLWAVIPGIAFSRWVSEPYGLERVEILRGPASVLYGQIPPGGLVNLVSKRPTATPQRQVELQVGSYNRKQGAFDFSGPLDERGKWLYRVTALVRDSDTQVDYQTDNRLFIAPALTWQPNADTSLTLLASYTRDDRGSDGWRLPSSVFSPNPNGRIPRNRNLGEPGFDHVKRKQSSLGYLFEHSLNEVWTLRQNLRYQRISTDNELAFVRDFQDDQRTVDRKLWGNHSNNSGVVVDNQAQAKLTLGQTEHTLLLGLDYQRSSSDVYGYWGDAPSIDGFAPVYGQPIVIPADPNRDKKALLSQIGVYAQNQIKFNQRWVGMIGGRWDNTMTEIDDRLADDSKQKDSAFTGRTGLVYLFDNGLAPYLSYATSFNLQIGEDAQGNAFEPTTGQQFEAGVKFQPEGGTTSITLAAFNIVQQNVLTSDPTNPGSRVQTGEIRSRGIELEGKAELTQGLSLIAAYTYLDAEITQSNDDDLGDRPWGISKNSASLWLDYTLHQGALRGLGFGGGARYIGSYYEWNEELFPAYTIVDLAAHYDLGDYRIALNVDNAFDKEIFSPRAYGAERTARMTLSYNF